MKLDIDGNPGAGNRYDEVSMRQVGNYNPQARSVSTHLHVSNTEHRLSRWFATLQDECRNDVRLQHKLDDIRRYRTRLPRTIGLEAKLRDGGFGQSDIAAALRSKQAFCKKSLRYQYFESAQRIDGYLFAKMSHLFDTYVMPLIREGQPQADIRQTVYEQVVMPIMEEINTYGADDLYLCYNEDDLYGMLYYLTGNCHINWTDYDVYPCP